MELSTCLPSLDVSDARFGSTNLEIVLVSLILVKQAASTMLAGGWRPQARPPAVRQTAAAISERQGAAADATSHPGVARLRQLLAQGVCDRLLLCVLPWHVDTACLAGVEASIPHCKATRRCRCCLPLLSAAAHHMDPPGAVVLCRCCGRRRRHGRCDSAGVPALASHHGAAVAACVMGAADGWAQLGAVPEPWAQSGWHRGHLLPLPRSSHRA